MTTLAIIETFDVIKYICSCFISRSITSPVNSKDKQEVFVKDSYVGYHAFLDYSVQMALTGYSRYLNVLDAFKPGQTYPDFMAFYIFRPGRAGDFIFLDIAH